MNVPFESQGASDPTSDPTRFDTIVRAIMDASAYELAGRHRQRTVLGQVVRWRRSVAAMAATAAAAAGLLLMTPQLGESDAPVTKRVTEAIGVPTALAQWMNADEPPGPAELLFPQNTETQHERQ
jgi:hypothetical protein